MDISTTLIGLVMLALFVVPIWYAVQKESTENKYFLKTFMEEARKESLNITAYDRLHHALIGVDRTAQKVLFAEINDEQITTRVVNLDGLKSCAVFEVSSTKKTKHGKEKVIGGIDLQFVYFDPKRADVFVRFYDGQNDLAPDGEMQLAEKWNTLLQPKLIQKQKVA